MSGKRGPTSDLNHENWDQEDNVEDAGTFKKASDDVLKRRVIKTAIRRNPASSFETTDSANKKTTAFGGFSAFAKTPANPSAAFGFLNTDNAVKLPLSAESTFKEAKKISDKLDGITNKLQLKHNTDTNGILPTSDIVISESSSKDDYLAKLKGLNVTVMNWINKKVDSNPFINLMPIFNDYQRYFDELEMKKDIIVNDSTKNELNKFSFKSPDQTIDEDPKTIFSFDAEPKTGGNHQLNLNSASTEMGKNLSEYNFDNQTKTPGMIVDSGTTFRFGAPENLNVAPTFSFKSPINSVKTEFIFGGTNSVPFTFTNVAKPRSDKNNDIIEINDDEPPKVEFTPVVEVGHIYATRCKIFVKKDGTFGDRGVGNLYLKPIPDSDKVQLIVRADTNLGNLLCNFVLSENIPTQRIGKKDVMLVCLPTPDVKPPPVPVLLRVKSSNGADELLKILEEHKK